MLKHQNDDRTKSLSLGSLRKSTITPLLNLTNLDEKVHANGRKLDQQVQVLIQDVLYETEAFLRISNCLRQVVPEIHVTIRSISGVQTTYILAKIENIATRVSDRDVDNE